MREQRIGDHMMVLAYIDPLSGSIILQAIAALGLGILYHFSRFRKRIHAEVRSLLERIRHR